MEHISSLTRKLSADVGFRGKEDINIEHPFRVGASGYDKNLNLSQIVEIAYSINPKPNIIVKPGPNRKWYIKNIPYNEIEESISHANTRRNNEKSTLWIISW